MNRAEYAEYEARVAWFRDETGLVSISAGTPDCPMCHQDWDDNGECRGCNDNLASWEEAYFNAHPCAVCHDPLGGDRHICYGWSETYQGIIDSLCVCTDCYYYLEYGRLDDQQMWEIEHSAQLTPEQMRHAATSWRAR